jgi:hypothetical protein
VARLPEKLITWPEIRDRILEYIPHITESFTALQKLSRNIAGGSVRSIRAKANEEKDGIKVIVTRGKGTVEFWIRPVFSGDVLERISITSDKGFAPAQVCGDLINPMAEMLKKEISAKVELKINPR